MIDAKRKGQEAARAGAETQGERCGPGGGAEEEPGQRRYQGPAKGKAGTKISVAAASLTVKNRQSRPCFLVRGSMCSDYEQHVAWAEYCRMMASVALQIPAHQTEFDLPQADDIRINDPALIIRMAAMQSSSRQRCSAFHRPDRREGRYSTAAPKAAVRRQQRLPRASVGVFRVHGHEIGKWSFFNLRQSSYD